MNRYILAALSVAGGILSGLAWAPWCPGLILLASFVPFFLIENHLFENRKKYSPNAFYLYLLPGMVIFNIISLGWIRAVSIPAAISVILLMSFLMSFALWLSHIVRIKAGNFTGSIALFSFWLGFEFLSIKIPLLSPWINLGNGLSKDIMFIQWYEVTGVAGGTLWILLSNLILSLLIVSLQTTRKTWRMLLWIWIPLIIIPSASSVIRFFTIHESEKDKNEFVIIQPDIDPFTEKFTTPFEVQLNKTIKMGEREISDKTAWVITPETTVDDPVNEDEITGNKYISLLRDLAHRHPGIYIISGLVSCREYSGLNEAPTSSARKIDATGSYYDHFNSAFLIDSGSSVSIYHKSKLVAGIEMQYTAGLGKLMNRILPNLGGTRWGYGTQKERDCFVHSVSGQVVAPVICYESVFGNYVADYVRKGAEALVIITNDGWWKNTNGYLQHLSYASLRAIETRRPVARAANTGVSCLIDIRGRRISETGWWEEAVLKGEISSETRLTPYVRYGDYIMSYFSVTGLLILAYIFIAIPLRNKYRDSLSK
jgi:apolipoprotein N-acyltransferase